MKIYAGTASTLPDGIFFAMGRYRYQVFVERLGWKLPTHARMEFDQFDRCDTVYVVACDARDRVIGTARLLPTDRPYLLAEVFPQLLGDTPAPQSPFVWEISRFAAVDLGHDTACKTKGFSTTFSLDLLRATMVVAQAEGARELVSVSPVGVERILRRGGFTVERATPPMRIDGHAVVACWIAIRPPASTARCLRRTVGGRRECASLAPLAHQEQLS